MNRYEKEMLEIYESLDWQLYDKLKQADTILRTMTSEMGLAKVSPKLYIPFLRAKLDEIIAQIAAEAKEGK